MKNKIISLALSLSLILSVFAMGFAPIVSHAAEEEILISTADELVDLAKKCSYDAWSIGKTVVLTRDISLEGVDFEPIPSFSGVFDGAGYKITGLNVTGAYAPAGFISSLEANGVVKNLTISGTITPDGDKGYVGGIVGDNSGRIEKCSFIGTVMGKSDVGGIVGINRLSGSISNCQSNGETVGETRIGGIAGSNEGLISSCHNSSKVNTVSITPSLNLSDINLTLTFDITKLPSLNTTSTSDIGGIAGYSCGMIMGCANSAPIGYPHIGYNVGGIVGRTNGHLNGNINSAEINGRKDVGGIVGQLEPYISYTLSEDLLASLKAELDAMSAEIAALTSSAGGSAPTVSGRLDTILENLDSATNALNTLMNDGADLGNGFIGEINRTGEILDEVISQLSGITADIPALGTLLGDSLRSLESALEDIESMVEIGSGAIELIKSASDNASLALGSINDCLNSLESGLTLLESSIQINDKDAAKAALDEIADGLSALVNATDEFTKSLTVISSILSDAAWVDKAIGDLDALLVIFGSITEYISTIYDATVEIKENIDVNWSKITEAGDELSISISYLAEAARELATAMTLMESGMDKVSEGLTLLGESVTVKDPEALEEAVETIGTGLDEMIAATAKFSDAMAELADVLERLEEGESINGLLGEAAGALGNLAEAGSEMSSAMITLGSGLNTLLENIEIDFDMAEEGGRLVIAGMGDISEALGEMQDASLALSESLTALDKAITAIKEAVVIKDEAKLEAALNSAYDAIGGIVSSMEEMIPVLTSLSDTLKEAKLWGDDLAAAISDSVELLTKMTGALVTIQDGVDKLRENVTFDLDAASEGLKAIKNGLGQLADAAGYMEDCFADISGALDVLDQATVNLPVVISNLRQAISSMADATELISSMSEKIHLLVTYLDGVDPIQFPTLDSSTIETANQLFAYISTIENELKLLNKEITEFSSDMIASVGRINDIMNNISDNIVDAIYGLENGELVDSNVTESEIGEITNGKLFACDNTGDVYGDLNIGGISGAMGIEYVLDPEDDLDTEMSITQKKQYQLKAVIHACTNKGTVVSKYDCAGGIAGKMDMGLIYGCESYCSVESQNGSYVGGIAGITYGLISQCFAKSSLAGGKYVGGIVGSGVTEGSASESSIVRNCYSMVYINRYTQYAGAISGANAGSFSENLFVSNLLAGIDRVSYAGKAEPISYEDLIKRKSIPTGFYCFTLEFVADGKLLYRVEFKYGESFDASIFPEIPAKDGHYSYWDTTDLTNLVFDTTVTAIYVPYVSTIVSQEVRQNGHNIFFVVGEFTKNDKLTVVRGCDTTTLVLDEGALTKDSLVESFTLTIPKGNLDTSNIHFLPENDSAKIFVKIDGIWQEIETKEFGSYLTFDVKGETIEIAIIERTLNIGIEIIVCLALILVQSIVIVCIVSNKKKKDKAKAKK